jgi:hypothetical protein
MIPDTNVDVNIATINEVSDYQETTIFYVRIKQEAAYLLLDKGYKITEVTRSLDVGETLSGAGNSQLSTLIFWAFGTRTCFKYPMIPSLRIRSLLFLSTI